jgi:GntR family transcriptional regulator
MALPAYLRILHDLRARIARGEWRIGEQIPTDEELMRLYGVSRFTVRAALDVLVADGVIRRYRRRGSFVAARPGATHTWMLTSLDDLVQGSFPTPPIIIDSMRVRCPPLVAAARGLEQTARALRIRALRRRDGEPYSCSEIHIPAALVKNLPKDWQARLESEAFVSQVAAGNGLAVHRAIQIAQAVGAPPDIASLLDIAEGAPLLLLERTFFSREGTALEHARIFCRPERYRQVIEFRSAAGRTPEESTVQPNRMREDA